MSGKGDDETPVWAVVGTLCHDVEIWIVASVRSGDRGVAL